MEDRDAGHGRPDDLGHADLGIASAHLREIDSTEIIHTVHERPVPKIPANNGLRTTS
jgi:hypothetical protein